VQDSRVSKSDQLMQRAQAATSLQDFGEGSFREGLDILVAAVEREARLTERGRAGFEMQIVDLLARRLQVEHWYRLHPEIDEQEIVAPLIGLGLPRTGSTALSCLLAEDPAVRSIRNWEAESPCPPPETATEHTDPRIEVANRMVLKRNEMFPRKMTMLPSSATAPTECQTYMGYGFKSQLFQALWCVPSYTEWLNHKADLVPAYRYVKRVLKLLQWRCPPTRWRLKNPGHILFIGALDRVFPDARYYMTHRDVGKVIPSVADLYYELMRASSDEVDKAYLGAMNTDWCRLGMQRLIEFRDAGNDSRFFDIHFAAFQKDPLAAIAQLYAFLGEEFSAEARARMQAWRDNTPRDKHGEHTYDAADFKIDLQRLRGQFRFYSERFRIEGGA
jgi:Sulfotransferase family